MLIDVDKDAWAVLTERVRHLGAHRSHMSVPHLLSVTGEIVTAAARVVEGVQPVPREGNNSAAPAGAKPASSPAPPAKRGM